MTMVYQSIRCLGSGYFGEVWLEHDDALDRPCAAKYVDPSRLAPALNGYAEAQAMIAGEHDNVVSVYSADMVAGAPVIRMEYLPEDSVQDKYAGVPAPVRDAVRLAEEACRGVQHLHSCGLLHRDVKPANLLLTGDGRVKVCDFGLSCVPPRRCGRRTAVGVHTMCRASPPARAFRRLLATCTPWA
jgi:serine/threonine-protein kinase